MRNNRLFRKEPPGRWRSGAWACVLIGVEIVPQTGVGSVHVR